MTDEEKPITNEEMDQRIEDALRNEHGSKVLEEAKAVAADISTDDLEIQEISEVVQEHVKETKSR